MRFSGKEVPFAIESHAVTSLALVSIQDAAVLQTKIRFLRSPGRYSAGSIFITVLENAPKTDDQVLARIFSVP